MRKCFLLFFLCCIYALNCSYIFGQSSNAINERRYNQVAYLTTHNSFNSEEDGFTIPNQTYGITQQLNDGVRALMLDVYNVNGNVMVYHGYSILGFATLESNLEEVKLFLDDNPNEIVTIIFECYAEIDIIEESVNSSDIAPYLYSKTPGENWNTLQEMIDSNKRLVVFSNCNDGSQNQPWYHFVWTYAIETHFEVDNIESFSCDYNSGNPNGDLFIFNHFIPSSIELPDINISETVNSNPLFIDRAVECWTYHNKFPNFITVDFYHTGNCMEVVNTLNQMNDLSLLSMQNHQNISISPNPTYDIVNITSEDACKLILYNTKGQQVHALNLTNNTISIDVSSYSPGVYFIKALYKSSTEVHKLMIL